MELEQVSRNLRAYRIKAGLTQDEASKLLGVSRQTLSGWENDVSSLTLAKFILLANCYGCELNDFFTA